MLDLSWVMKLYLGEFNFSCTNIISIVHLLTKLWSIETKGLKKFNLVLLE